MAQKRYVDRFPTSGSATIRYGKENQEMVKAEIEEFSSKGISVKSPVTFEAGAAVSFEVLFSFLGDVPICGTGQVKHVSEIKEGRHSYFKVGIESVALGKENFAMIIGAYNAHKTKTPPKKWVGPKWLPI